MCTVMSTYFDPVPGWTSNIYGPVGAMLASGLGMLRVFLCSPDKKFDFVPVDLCVNALICSAWEIHKKVENNNAQVQKPLAVYNYSGGPKRNITWAQLIKNTEGYEYPLRDALWITTLILTDNRFYFKLLWFFLHIIPGYFLDLYLYMTGRKPRIIKAYAKILKFSQVLAYFATREWNIVNNNIYNLWNRLNENDMNLFFFNMDNIDCKQYVQDICLGIKLYVMKETLDNAEAEKRHYQRLMKIHHAVKYTFMLILLIFFYKVITRLSTCTYSLIST